MSTKDEKERSSYRRRVEKLLFELSDNMGLRSKGELRADHDSLFELSEKIKLLDEKLLAKQRNTESAEMKDIEDHEDECDAFLRRVKVSMNLINIQCSSGNENPNNSGVLNRIKLPEITLPKFWADSTFDKMTCRAFFESFEHLISQYNLNELESYNLLDKQCEGRAKAMISSLNVVNQTYSKAKEILIRAFAEETPQKFTVIKQIINLNFVWGVDDPFLYYAEFKKLIDSVRDLNITLDEFLLYFIWSGLPSKFQDLIVSITNKAYPNLTELSDRFLEASNRYASHMPNRLIKSEVSVAATSQVGKFNKSKCILCFDESHSISKCTKYLTAQNKLDRLFELRLCSKCLAGGHDSKSCSFVPSGKCFKCKCKHWSFLCTGNTDTRKSFDHDRKQSSRKGESVSVSVNSISGHLNITDSLLPLLSVVPDILGKNNITVDTIMDMGSQNSFITVDLADQLDLTIVDKNISLLIKGINSSQKIVTKSVRFPFVIGNSRYEVVCICIPKINIAFKTPSISKLLDCLNKEGITLAFDRFVSDANCEEISSLDFLLGARDWHIVADMQIGTVGNPNSQSTYYKTNVGNIVLVGSIRDWLANYSELVDNVLTTSVNVSAQDIIDEFIDYDYSENTISYDNLLTIADDNELDSICDRFLSVDTINETDENLMTELELNEFIYDNSYKDSSGMHIMAIPWISRNKQCLSKNEYLALKVMENVVQKYKSTDILTRIDEVFKSQIDQGMIEKLDNFIEFKENNPDFSFLSHFPVVKEDRATSKVRVVYMANLAEKRKNAAMSLNQCIHPGFNKTPKIADALMQLKFDQTLLTFDISKAYHRLGMSDENSAHFLFYWCEDIAEGNYTPVVYKCNRIVFGMNVSPYLLHCCLKKILIIDEENDIQLRDLKQRIFRGSYVDNFSVGCNSLDELHYSHDCALQIFNDNGFPLQQFVCNNPDFQNCLDSGQDCETDIEVKLLGMKWNRVSDTISSTKFELNVKAETKRQIMCTLKTAFDLQNSNIPIRNRSKVFLQDLQKDVKCKWDAKLSPAKIHEWKIIAKQANEYEPPAVPRFIGTRESKYSLISLSDASKDFIGTVIYIRNECDNTLHYLISHNKVLDTSMRARTMPVLELCALEYATAKVRDIYCSLISSGKNICNTYVLTDSNIALSWIAKHEIEQSKAQKRSVFINNRISKVVKYSNDCKLVKFSHIGTDINTADMVTRLVSPNKFNKSNFISGPEVFKCAKFHDNFDWLLIPNQHLNNDELPTFSIATVGIENDIDEGETVLDLSRFSSLSRAVRVLTKVKLFIYKLKRKINIPCDENSVYDRNENINQLLRSDQKNCFGDVVRFLESDNKFRCKMPPLVSQMNVVLDSDRLLRVKSKFSNLRDTSATKHPILLSKESDFTRLVVLDYHHKFNHCGKYFLIHQLKTKYFICKPFSAVKNILKHCYHCKRFNSRTVKTNANDYKSWNVEPGKRIFSTCFIDCFGPFNTLYGGVKTKVYGVVFKCVWSKTINVEVVISLCTEQFIIAFQNHIYAYGLPERVISDEGSNFTSSFSQFDKFFNSIEVRSYLDEYGIQNCEFEQYPPGSLNRGIGGIIECSVGLLKRLVQGSIRNNTVEFVKFCNVMNQCVSFANKRPITGICSLRDAKSDEIGLVLTPEILKFGYELPVFEVTSCRDPDSVSDDADEEMSKLIKIKNRVRDFYATEFLYGLIDQATKSKGKFIPVTHQTIEIGDIVLIKDEFVKPANYQLGRVLQVTVNSISETTRVKLLKGNKSVVNRDISSVILFVKGRRDENPPELLSPVDDQTKIRPQRKAALECKERNRNLLNSSE